MVSQDEPARVRKSVNVRSGRETTITIQPSDKPVTIVITPVVKQGRQWLAIPPGAAISHKQLTLGDEKA